MIPSEITLFILSAAPFGLYAAIPAGIDIYKFSIWKSVVISIAGNMVTAVFIFIGLGFISKYLSIHSVKAKHFLDRIYSKTRRKYGERFRLLGSISLVTFVATPAPGAGARTGIIPAFVFGVPFSKSFFLILFGLLIKSFIVVLTMFGAKTVFYQIKDLII